jgi:hypothetical protein
MKAETLQQLRNLVDLYSFTDIARDSDAPYYLIGGDMSWQFIVILQEKSADYPLALWSVRELVKGFVRRLWMKKFFFF